ncbi:MAG: IclR family transcriptional regulator [Gammaproteobacteria bacterium]|nr:IclR family transcriptional regulator [Gammaproteobacteria bacterium]
MQSSRPGETSTDDRLGVESVERALSILDALGNAQARLTLKELALKTGLSKPTILRLAVSLERFGYLRKNAHGEYGLGPTLWRLGSAYRQNLEIETVIRPALEALVSLTQESASFWVARGRERICLYRVNSPRSARSHVDEGEASPLDKGSGGHVLSFAAGKPTPYASEIGTQYVVATSGERDPDVASVSAPVYGPNNEFLGALTLAGILSRFEPQVPQFKVIVRQAAAAVTKQLGGDFPWPPRDTLQGAR